MRQSQHEHWSSNWTFLLAAVGSAVGLGNIWKFPYMTGTNGGGAFVILYMLCVVFFVVPILIAELMLGRRGQGSAVRTMQLLIAEENRSSQWIIIGWLGIIIAYLVLSIFSVIASWTLAYTFFMISGNFEGADIVYSKQVFEDLLRDPVEMTFWHFCIIVITTSVVARGVNKGLEKAVDILMPALFIMLVILVINATVNGEFGRGWEFMFAFDISHINVKTLLIALGQAFLSVSVAMGIMMTYGAYLHKSTSISNAAVTIAGADTLVAITAGLAIFPIVFAYDIQVAEGPGLIFVALPVAFGEMPAGQFFGTMFFLVLLFAGITSTISLLEPAVSFLQERSQFRRAYITLVAGVGVFLLGLLTVFSFNIASGIKPLYWHGSLGSMTFFELLDALITNILLPLSGLLIAIFAGWKMSVSSCRDELALVNSFLFRTWLFLVRFVVPICLVSILFSNLLNSA